MQSLTLFDHPPLAMPVEVRGYHIDLELVRDRATLTLAGDLDAAATNTLRSLLSCIERVPGPVHVRADAVLGADLDAFDPLLKAAQGRRTHGLPGVWVESVSEAVVDLFGALGISAGPPVHLDGSR